MMYLLVSTQVESHRDGILTIVGIVTLSYPRRSKSDRFIELLCRQVRLSNFKCHAKSRLAPRFGYDLPQEHTADTSATKVHVNGNIVNINDTGEKPIEDITNDPAVCLGYDRTSTCDLQFLKKKTHAPREAIRCPLDDHDFIHIRSRHGPKS